MTSNSRQLFDRIETFKNLPTLPHILLEFIATCNKPDSTNEDISQIINKDSSLTAKVMRMVNSAYYGLPNRVTSMEHALLLLGTDAVKNIAISASVFQAFAKTKGDSVFNLKLFWRHSLLCATTAKLIGKKVSYGSPDEAFLSGLLHDIGKLVLWVNFPEEYAAILQSSNNESDLLLAGERGLGATHCEVAAWMIGQWHLQSFMADAVLYHHEPVDRVLGALPLVKIVFIANVLSRETTGDNELRYKTAQEVFEFSRSEVETVMSQAEEEVMEIARSLGIDIGAPEVLPATVSETDRKKENDLVSAVRDVSLLQGTLQNLLEASGQDSILKVVKQGLQILFDVHSVIFLIHDPEKEALVGKDAMESMQDALVKELVVPLQTKACLPIASLRQKTPLDSFGHLRQVELTILDHQLIRLIGKDGFLCLPMIAREESVGVILLGTEQARISHLGNQVNLLTMYANQSALALQTDMVREVQSRLVQSERLAAASGIARRVVHEVNNPLGIIKNYIKILGLKLSGEDPAQEELKIISEELDRVALIVRELSGFSEPQAGPSEFVDINDLLSDLVKITRESLMRDAKINVHLNLEPSLPTVLSGKNSLKQVFINLVKNAVEAMPQGGNLYINTRRLSNRLQTQTEQDMKGAFDSVEIRIQDEGPGIPDNIRSRLFEPFVTSKSGEHAGLGLSVAYNIMNQLKGAITCESGKKTGTIFKIVLPVRQNQKA
ncbi:MAG: HDOD domain-containing protein [Deltaproteobacteria bacterium]|jgi:nitrogen-specific signal transduction histidine kinase/HD-like signal output (HDOD) protein